MAPMLDDDFVLTIDDEDAEGLIDEEEEVVINSETTSKKRKRGADTNDSLKSKAKNKKSKKKHKQDEKEEETDEEPESLTWADNGEDDGAMASDFEFAAGDVDTGVVAGFDGWGTKDGNGDSSKTSSKNVDLDEIIARRKKAKGISNNPDGAEDVESDQEEEPTFAGFEDDELLAEDGFGMGAVESEDEDGSEKENDSSDEADEDMSEDEDDEVAKPVPHPDDMEQSGSEQDEDENEDPVEAERRAAFFAAEGNVDEFDQALGTTGSFQQLSLSRPILKGLASVGFSKPTPIQAKTIPVALRGVDIVGGAETGSGKTGAFILPILERLLYRPKKVPTTRVVVLMPTRELAVQCFNVSRKLASFTDITFALIVGGLSLREQEQVLKTRPDVVIATPGRFIDHFRNSSFAVDAIEILVLDEADRMLEEGFADELNEILSTIPKSRQTMLFSATMTNSVDKLIRVGLKRPVRLMVNAKRQTVKGLVQEFIRLRPGKEDKRLAYLLYLCKQVYTNRTIIFFRQKKEAHRVRVVFGLCGLKAAELHGSMSQEQRIQAVEAFRSGTASYLLATDLASRGLDIKGVDTVINYEAPQSHDIYLHRVGRTARAGRSGRSCTLAAEPDRKVVKAAVKAARAQGAKIASRIIPTDEADAWAERLDELEADIEAVLKEEKEEKALGAVERDIRKGENLVKYESEIHSRPKRTWFENEKDKKAAKEAGLRELNGEIPGKKVKRKLSNKEKKKLDLKDMRKEVGNMGWKKGKAERGKDVASTGKKVIKKSKGKPSGRSKTRK